LIHFYKRNGWANYERGNAPAQTAFRIDWGNNNFANLFFRGDT